jgi:hypothetical protein
MIVSPAENPNLLALLDHQPSLRALIVTWPNVRARKNGWHKTRAGRVAVRREWALLARVPEFEVKAAMPMLFRNGFVTVDGKIDDATDRYIRTRRAMELPVVVQRMLQKQREQEAKRSEK